MVICSTWEYFLINIYSFNASNSNFTKFLTLPVNPSPEELWSLFIQDQHLYIQESVSRERCHVIIQKAITVSVLVRGGHRVWDRFQSWFVLSPGSLIQ